MEELKARDLMSTEVITVSPKATVTDAAKKMVDNRVSGLPVVDDEGKLIGVISEGDLLRRVEIGTDAGTPGSLFTLELAHQFLKAHGQHVEDVMTQKVASVVENTGLTEIASLMQLMRFKRVPVTDHGKVIGVVSRADVLKVLVREAERPSRQS
jgi:CBS domain-containing protein